MAHRCVALVLAAGAAAPSSTLPPPLLRPISPVAAHPSSTSPPKPLPPASPRANDCRCENSLADRVSKLWSAALATLLALAALLASCAYRFRRVPASATASLPSPSISLPRSLPTLPPEPRPHRLPPLLPHPLHSLAEPLPPLRCGVSSRVCVQSMHVKMNNQQRRQGTVGCEQTAKKTREKNCTAPDSSSTGRATRAERMASAFSPAQPFPFARSD